MLFHIFPPLEKIPFRNNDLALNLGKNMDLATAFVDLDQLSLNLVLFTSALTCPRKAIFEGHCVHISHLWGFHIVCIVCS